MLRLQCSVSHIIGPPRGARVHPRTGACSRIWICVNAMWSRAALPTPTGHIVKEGPLREQGSGVLAGAFTSRYLRLYSDPVLLLFADEGATHPKSGHQLSEKQTLNVSVGSHSSRCLWPYGYITYWLFFATQLISSLSTPPPHEESISVSRTTL